MGGGHFQGCTRDFSVLRSETTGGRGDGMRDERRVFV